MKNALVLLFTISLFVINAAAGGPQIWSVNSRLDILKGDARGVSIGDDGTISIAPKAVEAFKTGEQYIWSSASDSAGNVFLGTGGDGKVFRVDVNGKGAVFADLAEINVSALAVAANGDVFAATMPDGKVYRIDTSGKATVYFEPKTKYIWAIVVLGDGSLGVATGDGGKLYKVKAANATPESSLLFDSGETHIISLVADKQGNLYAGTDPGGLVLRFSPDGKAFGLLDSPLREIHDIAVAADGSLYALAIADSASAKATDAAAEKPAAPEYKPMTVERPTLASDTPAKSRYDLSAAKSAVYHIMQDGGSDLIWTSGSVTGFSLTAAKDAVWIGTSDKGRIYSVTNSGRETLLLQTDAAQLSTIRIGSSGMFATSSNQGSLYRISADAAAEGNYESPVLDARSTATWGRIWWRGQGNVTIQTRSGNTEKADSTWSDWSSGQTDAKGGQISSPKAKYLQWRAVLKGTPSSAALNEVNVSFAARNIAPEVLSLSVLPTNIGLAANPPQQIDPNIELAGMDPVLFGLPNAAVPPRRVYQRAARSLQWTADDRNGDRLIFDVYYKEIGDSSWKLLRGDLTDNFLAIDGQTLADGRYLFKVAARDTPSNPLKLALAGERITDPVEIDNTAPIVASTAPPQITGDKARVIFDASDSSSYIARAEYSVNGGDWLPLFADDGICDGPREQFTIEIALPTPGEYSVTVRVYDINGNSGNARVVVKK